MNNNLKGILLPTIKIANKENEHVKEILLRIHPDYKATSTEEVTVPVLYTALEMDGEREVKVFTIDLDKLSLEQAMKLSIAYCTEDMEQYPSFIPMMYIVKDGVLEVDMILAFNMIPVEQEKISLEEGCVLTDEWKNYSYWSTYDDESSFLAFSIFIRSVDGVVESYLTLTTMIQPSMFPVPYFKFYADDTVAIQENPEQEPKETE